METIRMKMLMLSRNNKKTVINLLSAQLAEWVVKVKVAEDWSTISMELFP